ncbi:MAG: Lrp/AsnC family leucine-responsive transcriptional regulator [Bacteroidia bacterium]|jgi:Lrp/AsnC family leucine-responsive transcriptional regulator
MSTFPVNLDDIDKKILNYLQVDGKLTAKNLADKISLTQTPVYERIRKLERLGVIKNYVALIDPLSVNKELLVFMNLTLKEHGIGTRELLIKEVRMLPEVVELFHTSGVYDFVAKVRVADVQEYRDFLVEKLGRINNIKDIVSHMVLDEIIHSTKIPV